VDLIILTKIGRKQKSPFSTFDPSQVKIPPVVKDLVAYAVSRMNIQCSMISNSNVCPRVLFTGLKPDFCKELSIAFGVYFEVFSGLDNMDKSSSVPCVALYPCSNSTSPWVFNNLIS